MKHVTTTPPQFRNLVFEGGGIKGIAYAGALRALEERHMLKDIVRVGGTSAGAITALLFALGYDAAAQKELMTTLDFSRFMDSSFGFMRDIRRLRRDFGWYRGSFFLTWIGDRIEEKLGSRLATFDDLAAAGRPGLYVVGTNLSTQSCEVFCRETHPTMPLAHAVRISMSVPLVFAAVRYGPRKDVYVDGGVLANYPVKLFDDYRFIDTEKEQAAARETSYYTRANTRDARRHGDEGTRVYNRQTLGFRVDSTEEIAYFHDGTAPRALPIHSFSSYVRALTTALTRVQERYHLHSDDWQRTVYINTQDISALDFDLNTAQKDLLLSVGYTGVETYLAWFHAPKGTAPVNRID